MATGQRTGTPLPLGDGTAANAENDVEEVAFSPDGKVVAASDGVVVRLWDVASRAAITPPQITDPIGLAFSPDSGTLAVAESYERLWLYRLPD